MHLSCEQDNQYILFLRSVLTREQNANIDAVNLEN